MWGEGWGSDAVVGKTHEGGGEESGRRRRKSALAILSSEKARMNKTISFI